MRHRQAAATLRPVADKAVRCVTALALTASTMLGCIAGITFSKPDEAWAKKADSIEMTFNDYIRYNGYKTAKMTYEEDGETRYAICAEPMKDTPASGKYKKVTDEDDIKAALKKAAPGKDAEGTEDRRYEKLRMLQYYLNPSSPGYDKSLINDKLLAAMSGSNKEKHIALLHIATSDCFLRNFKQALTGCDQEFRDLIHRWLTGGYAVGDGEPYYPDSVYGKLFNENHWKSSTYYKNMPKGFNIWLANTGSATQTMFGFNGLLTGDLEIVKTSADDAITGNSTAYSLAGAVYEVYGSKEDAQSGTERIARMVTDEKGHAKLTGLGVGNVYIKETKAPQGYEVNDGIQKAKIKDSEVTKLTGKDTAILSDAPKTLTGEGLVLLNKVNRATGDVTHLGDGTLAGAVFELKQYSEVLDPETGEPTGDLELQNTWRFKTDDKGEIDLSKANIDNLFVPEGSDPLILAADGSVVLPLGPYTIQEVSAPEGFLVNGEVISFNVDGSGATVSIDNERLCPDTPEMGKVVIQKNDAERDESRTQGDATLENIEFTIVNASDDAVKDGNDVSHEVGDVVCTIATHWDAERGAYVAETPEKFLQYGTYKVHESRANGSYKITDGRTYTFEIREDGSTVTADVDGGNMVFSDNVVRGGVRVVKNDLELQKSEAIAGNSHEFKTDERAGLDGIQFQITNASTADPAAGNVAGNDGRVLVNGKWYAVGEVVDTITTHWDKDLKAYVAETKADTLPYGTYTVRETATNDSYLLTDGTVYTFQIREDGKIVTADVNGKTMNYYDQVVRNDLRVSKKADATSTSMKVPFAVKNEATGETHVLVTDRNGQVTTQTSWNKHSNKTNGNDSLLTKQGKITAEDMDDEAGIWFSKGEDGSHAAVDDSLGAMPYGRYTITELPCDANEGYTLISKSVWIMRDTTVAEPVWMTLDDQDQPAIGTTATGDSGKYIQAPDGTQVTIEDSVRYENLLAGETYTVEGTLMDKATGKAVKDVNGKEVTASTEFKAAAAGGTAKVTFTFKASGIEGTDLVAFERVLGADGKVVASHEDIDDADQTVHVTKVGTTATNEAGGKTINGSEAVIVDTIAYSNLPLGAELTATASLRDAATGEIIPCAATPVTFTPSLKDGTVKVTIKVDASALGGRSVTVFESIATASGNVIAKHAELADKGQTVSVSSIATTATDAADGDHYITAGTDGTATVNDRVEYKGLVAGAQYTLNAELVDASNGNAVVANGTASFTPTSADGYQDVRLTADVSQLGGHSLVVLETLLDASGKVAGEHKDLTDKGQTVSVVEVGTTLANSDGSQTVKPDGKVTLTDTVSYKGLTAGETYKLTGTLMDKSTGQPATDAAGAEITATADFTAPAANGTAEVTFEFDGSKLAAGTELVAFERLLSANGTLIASHEDINDAGQTVAVEEADEPEKPGKDKTDKPDKPSKDDGDTPDTPDKEKTGKKYSKTGSDTTALVAAGAGLVVAGAAAAAFALRRRKSE